MRNRNENKEEHLKERQGEMTRGVPTRGIVTKMR
jgi:hypothetical protein